MDPVTLRIQAEVTDAANKVLKLRDDYLKFAAQYKAASREMQQVVNSFSGDAVIRTATQYTEAIRRMGGVTTLTAAEKTKLNRVLQEAIDKYRVLGAQAPAAMEQLLKATEQTSTKSSKFFSDFFGDFFVKITGSVAAGNLLAAGITKAFSLIGTAIETATKKLAEFFGYLVQRGGEVARVEEGFKKLTFAAGQSSEAILKAGREGLKGLTNDFEIMQAANRAMLLGLEVTPEKFKTLTEAAVTLGRAMNLNTAKALDDLTIALGRTSPRILDNLGIIVKIKDANEAYAKSIDKNVRSLSAEEKQLAFSIMAMEKIRQKVLELGEVNLTLSDRVDQMKARWQNFLDLLSVAVVKSPVLNEVFNTLGAAIDQALGPNKVQVVQLLIDIINKAAILSIQATKVFTLLGTGIVLIFQGYIDQLTRLVDFGYGSLERLARFIASTSQAMSMLNNGLTDGFGKVSGSLRELADESAKVRARLTDQGKSTSDFLGRQAANAVALHHNLQKLEERMKEAAKIRVEETTITKGLVQLQRERIEVEEELSDAEKKREKERKQRLERERRDYEAFVRGERDLFKIREGLVSGLFNSISTYKGVPPVDKWLGEMSLWQEKITERAKYADKLITLIANTNADKILKAPPLWVPPVDQLDRIKGYNDSLKDTAQIFTNIKQVSGEAWGGAVEAIAQIMNAAALGGQVGMQFTQQFYDPKKTFTGRYDAKGQPVYTGGFSFSKGFKNEQGEVTTQSALAGGAQLATTAIQGYGTMQAATGNRSKGKNIAGGAAAGAQIGGSIVPGYGHAIGAVVGAVWGAVRGKALREVTDRVAKDFGGFEISEDLSKQMAKTADERFRKDRRSAEVFHTSATVAEMGGVSSRNIRGVEGNLRDVFDLMNEKHFDTDTARQVINENFGAVVGFYEKSKTVVSKQVRDIIELNASMKVNSEEVRAFVEKNVATVDQGVQKMLGKQMAAYGGIAKAIEDQKKRVDEAAVGSEDPERFGEEDRKGLEKEKAAYAELIATQKKGAEESSVVINRAGRMIAATFNAAQKQGLSYSESFDQLSGSLSTVSQLHQDLGIEIENAFVKALVAEQSIIDKNPDLIEGVRSYNETLVAMGNLNAINAESFGDAQAQAVDYYNQLIAAGISNESALKRIEPALRTILTLGAENNFTIDEGTQNLLNQADAAGILKTKQMDQLEATQKGFKDVSDRLEVLITTLGGKLPDAWGTVQKKSDEAGKTMKGSLLDAKDAAEKVRDRLGDVGRAATDAAAEAELAFARVRDSAGEAEDAVNGVSVGHSPGGIKDMKPHLKEAEQAFRRWSVQAVADATKVQETIDRLNFQSETNRQKMMASIVPRHATINEETHIMFAPHVIDPDGFQDVMELKGLPHIIEGLRSNRAGALSELRNLLGIK